MNNELMEVNSVVKRLFDYLRDVIYNPSAASLDLDKLPEEFKDFAKGLVYFCDGVLQAGRFARELSLGNLNCPLPPTDNELASPLKMLHASLKHLSWQAQQVASGDYQQRVDFMGDFSLAFNNMIGQLKQRWSISHDEKSRLKRHVDLLLVNCPDPILIFDKEHRLVHASDSYLQKSGIGAVEEIVGKSIRELFAPLAQDELLDLIEGMTQRVVYEKKSTKAEQYIELGSGDKQRFYQIQVSPMLDERGCYEGMLLLLDDITEMHKARKEAERAREIAERSSRAKSDFLARMSHEMRTPLNAIIGMTAIYQTNSDGSRRADCIKKIDNASKHLLGVIDDVLDMANIQTDNFSLIEAEFDFSKTLDKIIFNAGNKLCEKQQRLRLDIAEFSSPIVGDEQRLTQVIQELIFNAAKFTPHGGDISLTVKKTGDAITGYNLAVSVTDNGIGISTEQQKKLFRPFEQVSGGVSRRYGGSGLGLAISKHIIMLMGGSITLESELGMGATFSFEVPLKPASPQEQSEDSGEDGIFENKRILIVEDIEINAEIIVALLEHTKARLDVASDGLEALEKFASDPTYNLILMDINMPRMDGYEATKQIRALPQKNAASVPIVAMTANVYRGDIEKCLSVGMDNHIGKPIIPATLISTLKKYLKKQ